MRNFKKIFSIALTLSIVICFAGCKKTPKETPPSPVKTTDETVAAEKVPYKIVQTNNNNQKGYTYYLYDKDGKVVYEETVVKEPIISYVTDSILEIRDSHGTTADKCKYYDLTTCVVSDFCWNPSYTDGKIVVYMEYDETRDPSVFLVVKDIFDSTKKYIEYDFDFSPVAVPANAIKSVKHINENILEIVWLSGEDYKETTNRIDIS